MCSDLNQLKKGLHDLTKSLRAVDIETGLLHSFGHSTIYLEVMKSLELAALHKHVHQFLKSTCEEVFHLYEPSNWVPHITLAMEDLDESQFQAFMKTYKSDQVQLHQTLTSLTLVEYTADGQIQVIEDFAFGQ
ncbi:2'-5' RNA ligase family protein [Alkalicoccobacillus murimartini]|uniref:2'-5' RNA ligase n=1 Tax=Alkalicoccobacillus murimartini TaxID=171685 RepID=A0ABT9YM94_9BACI|nr:2'-5' RNA ligase family protein [Alkalicoccobacillus murimartini]MDQ0208764.1 2'-5' RNA ligase [Alkalicoccobacillus murimartini]